LVLLFPALSILIPTFLSTPLLARDYDVKTEVNLLCEELDAKSYYADGAMQNVKKDGEPLEVYMTADEVTLKYPSIKTVTKYIWASGIMDTDESGLQIMNIQFIASMGGTWGTKTVTFIIDNSFHWWMIQTEPMIELGRPFIRTHYHECFTR